MTHPVPLRVVLFAAAYAALVTGCGEPSRGTTGGDGPKMHRIAVIPKGTTHDFWKSIHAGAQQAADELGNVEIIWKGTPTEADKEKQIQIVESFVVEQVDGIVLAPIDRESLVPAVRRAKQSGIPVVVFDSGLSDEVTPVSHVATDNHHGGVVAAERIVELLGGKGNVILLRYQAGSESTEQRERGFLETIAKHPDIKILSEAERVGSDANHALQISQSLLTKFGDEVDAIFTVCEPNNTGMLQALENAKLAGKVKFVGFDSTPRFVRALEEEKMHGLVLQDPVRMGYLAVKTMAAHLDGQPVEKRISTGEFLATPENRTDPKIHELLHPVKHER
ncbi:MAG: substrate-binding domain-containing protein [Planctomycetaceae bacterium]